MATLGKRRAATTIAAKRRRRPGVVAAVSAQDRATPSSRCAMASAHLGESLVQGPGQLPGL